MTGPAAGRVWLTEYGTTFHLSLACSAIPTTTEWTGPATVRFAFVEDARAAGRHACHTCLAHQAVAA